MPIKTAKPIDDLELYELIVAAYPDRFDENSDEDIWDEVMEFADHPGLSGAGQRETWSDNRC